MEYGIKLGDIFYDKKSDLKSFFQVVGFNAKKRVVLKEIESEIDSNSSTDGGHTYTVKPLEDKFKTDSSFTPNDETITKLVLRDEYDAEQLYVSIKYDKNHREQFFLWKGEEIKNDYYWIWWH